MVKNNIYILYIYEIYIVYIYIQYHIDIQVRKACWGPSSFNGFLFLTFRFKTSSRCSPDWEVHPWVWWIWPLRLLLDASPHFPREEEEPAQTLHFHACWWTRKPGKAGQWWGCRHGWPQQEPPEQKVDLILWDLQCSKFQQKWGSQPWGYSPYKNRGIQAISCQHSH